jgi:tRNA(adenine34) deaminase
MKIRNRASALCVVDGQLLVVLLCDPLTGMTVRMPPGGKVESGEEPRETALRELLEETGYVARLEPDFEKVVDYDFDWAGETHACRTHFYKATIQGEQGPITATESFLVGNEWMPLEDLQDEWDFHPQLSAALLPILNADE